MSARTEPGLAQHRCAGAVQACLAAIGAQPQDAALALTQLRAEAALAEARALDAAPGPALPLAGEAWGAKACFDVAGWTTHAGSRVLASQAPATADAPLVQRLRAAGAVLLAQNNMTEFAYGALGLNPWYGTPLTPALRDAPRVAGGSSSGGAVAVALGLQTFALGSDTSGSARIPAAFCGVVGFKPSHGRYDDRGLARLSISFDVPGLITASVAQCRRLDRVLASAPGNAGQATAGDAPVLLVPAHLDSALDAELRPWLDSMLARLQARGFALRRQELPSWLAAPRAAREGGIISAEAHALHHARLPQRLAEYDPLVGPRILQGGEVRASDYLLAQAELARQRQAFEQELGRAWAVLCPTVPMKPPTVAELAAPERYLQTNARAFSLTEPASRLDLPSITLPGSADAPWLGLMLSGRSGHDAALLQLAARLEQALAL